MASVWWGGSAPCRMGGTRDGCLEKKAHTKHWRGEVHAGVRTSWFESRGNNAPDQRIDAITEHRQGSRPKQSPPPHSRSSPQTGRRGAKGGLETGWRSFGESGLLYQHS